jgi:hypothetical protein
VISYVLYFISVSTVLISILLANRKIKITHYHEEDWKPNDVVLSATFLGIILIWLMLQTSGALPSVLYSPYPTLRLPVIQLSGVMISASTILPLIFINK